MRKRVLRRLVALIMVFACLIAWRFLPRERRLLEYARRVADTTLWGVHDSRFNNSIGRH